MEEVKIVSQGADIIQSQEKAQIDIQISTAKAYPRDIKRVVENGIVMATLDKETAASCKYSLPRAGKNLTGATIQFAKMVASEWGNLRVESRITKVDGQEVVAEATCFDLQKNFAVRREFRKKIATKDGKLYSQDMITTTGLAAASTAMRNAILDCVPKAIWQKIYSEAEKVAIGELSDSTKLAKAKKSALDYFEETFGANVNDVLNALNLRSEKQIKANEVEQLRGIINALKDGESTPEEVFGWTKESADEQKKKMKEKGTTKTDMP